MDLSEIEEHFQNIEIFIALRNQHFVIQAWMELKKINKRVNSFYSSQARSYATSYISSVDTRYLRDKSLSNYYCNFYSHKNSATDLHAGLNQQPNYEDTHIKTEMFNSFNKNYLEVPDASIEKREHHYQKGKTFESVEDERQLDDSDQFEDVVLDRLSKLEENINKIMKERKQKDLSRGYIGAPINSTTRQVPQRTTSSHQKTRYIHNTTQVKSPQIYRQNNPSAYQLSNFRQGRNNINRQTKSYNNNQDQKYSINRRLDEKVDINKIKQMIQNSHHQDKHSVENDNYGQKIKSINQEPGKKSKYIFYNNVEENQNKSINSRSINQARQNYKTNHIINRYQRINQVQVNPNQQIKSGETNKRHFIPNIPYHGSFKLQKSTGKTPLNRHLKNTPEQNSSYIGLNTSKTSYKNAKVNSLPSCS